MYMDVSMCGHVYVMLVPSEARGGGSSSARITGNFEPPDMDVVKLKLRLLQELEALLFTEPSL